ncbi:MAG: molecular chaperone HtpG [Bacilli bacterium]|nr:molecular chaperone HtpG [Bacilli bacterium]
MKKKQFKAESKRLLDLMINSIYTNKEIFLRELISNASDAIDKLYYMSLTDRKVKLEKDDFYIKIDVDKDKNTLTIRDNGIGMSEEELEDNLGTIAQSGTLLFKEENKNKETECIGQFGVGFYSAFMVSDEIEVLSKKYGEKKAHIWKSSGADGYTIDEAEKEDYGTEITLHLKEDTDDEKYSKYADEFTVESLIKKYSDYIKYPIKMDLTHEHENEETKEKEVHTHEETINSMVPLWKKNKNEVSDEDYDRFYMDKFYDYEKPLATIHSSVEGKCSYNALLYIPAKAPYDFYTKEFEKGLELYSNGVMIMEKCGDLLPDYFSFVRGLVDTPDVSLNISREMLQQDAQVKTIAKSIETKIKKELESMLEERREDYEKFFKTFGINIKFGIYNSFGANNETLKDLIMFYSSTEKKLTTLKEYVERMKEDQDCIYYACGETVDKIDLLPQTDQAKEKGYEVLYLTEYVDEFALQMLKEYDKKKFINVSSKEFDLDTKEEKEELEKHNEDSKDMFSIMKEGLDVKDIRFTKKLKNHPVCLTTEGNVSTEMEKVINAMPTDETIKAEKILEINESHPIVEKLQKLYKEDKEELKKYSKVLYAQARLIEGLPIDNPTEITNLICDIITK